MTDKSAIVDQFVSKQRRVRTYSYCILCAQHARKQKPSCIQNKKQACSIVLLEYAELGYFPEKKTLEFFEQYSTQWISKNCSCAICKTVRPKGEPNNMVQENYTDSRK